MPARKPKSVIYDIGSESGEFTNLLRKRHPNARVVGIDRDPRSAAEIKDHIGRFFLYNFKKDTPVKGVWVNHVDIFSGRACNEFQTMVEKLPPGTPVVLTMRKEHIGSARNAVQVAGLEIKKEFPWNPRLIGSPFTRKFYREAQAGSDGKTPIRIVAVKPKK